MNRVRLGMLLLVVAIALQLSWYTMLMVSYIRTPDKLAGADFLFYYSVGQVAREHGLKSVYNLELESAAQAVVADLLAGRQQSFLPNHPPFLFPIVLLLSGLNYRTAYRCFVFFLFLLVMAGLPLLSSALNKKGWTQKHVFVALIGVILFEPLFISLLKGQDSALLLLGGLLWLSGLLKKDDRLAGLGLSLTLIRPQIALVLAIPFLFQQRKVFFWFLTGAIVLSVYSFVLVGWPGVMDYLRILTLSTGGEGFGLAESAMFNITGLILRIAPSVNLRLVHIIGWVCFAIALAGLCVRWARSKSIGYDSIALAVCLSLFVAPHLHYHDLALLVVPLVGLGLAGVSSGRLRIWIAAALPMVVSIILLFSEFWDPARFSAPYLLMAAIPVLTTWYERH